MKKLFKNKERLIAYFLIIFIILSIVDNIIYRNKVERSIDEYIEAQGLKNEEILNDSGVKYWYGYSRTIVYKNNPDMAYIYVSNIKNRFSLKNLIPFYNSLTYNSKIENKSFYYKGISLSWDYLKGSDDPYEVVDPKEYEPLMEGELDIYGNLFKEIKWKK